jgi:hypothetical protein
MDMDEEGDLTAENNILLLVDDIVTMVEAIHDYVLLMGEIDLETVVEHFWLFRALLFFDLFLISRVC